MPVHRNAQSRGRRGRGGRGGGLQTGPIAGLGLTLPEPGALQHCPSPTRAVHLARRRRWCGMASNVQRGGVRHVIRRRRCRTVKPCSGNKKNTGLHNERWVRHFRLVKNPPLLGKEGPPIKSQDISGFVFVPSPLVSGQTSPSSARPRPHQAPAQHRPQSRSKAPGSGRPRDSGTEARSRPRRGCRGSRSQSGSPSQRSPGATERRRVFFFCDAH